MEVVHFQTAGAQVLISSAPPDQNFLLHSVIRILSSHRGECRHSGCAASSDCVAWQRSPATNSSLPPFPTLPLPLLPPFWLNIGGENLVSNGLANSKNYDPFKQIGGYKNWADQVVPNFGIDWLLYCNQLIIL
jgi:hypothetical protein